MRGKPLEAQYETTREGDLDAIEENMLQGRTLNF